MAVYEYRRSGLTESSVLSAILSASLVGMVDVFGAYKQLALCVAATPLVLVGASVWNS